MTARFIRIPKKNEQVRLKSEQVVYLAEGNAEAWYLEKLLDAHGFDSTIHGVICTRGRDLRKIKAVLRALYTTSEWEQVVGIGLFFDAEQSYPDTKNNLQNALRSIPRIDDGFVLNPQTVQDADGYKIASFISPALDTAGRIEDLVLAELRKKDDYQCFAQLEECLPEAQDAKAAVNTYITHKKPGLCGTHNGFRSGVLDFSDEAYAEVSTLFAQALT